MSDSFYPRTPFALLHVQSLSSQILFISSFHTQCGLLLLAPAISDTSCSLSKPFQHTVLLSQVHCSYYHTLLLPFVFFSFLFFTRANHLAYHVILRHFIFITFALFCTLSLIAHALYPYNNIGTTVPLNIPIFTLPNNNLT